MAQQKITGNEITQNLTLQSLSATSINSTPIGNTTPSSGAFTTLTDSGNLNFTGISNRITGDFSNATVSSRVFFQTSIANSPTSVGVMPNGTSSISTLQVFNSSDPNNASYMGMFIGSGVSQLTSSQTGTGTFFPMTFYTSNLERMRIDEYGNLGLGVTPSAWQFGGNIQLNGNITSNGAFSLSSNAYFNAGWYYVQATQASQYAQNSGQHLWFTAPSGTAGSPISFTQAMTLTNTGHLLLGTTLDSGPVLNLASPNSTGYSQTTTNTASPPSNANEQLLVLQNNTAISGLTFSSSDSRLLTIPITPGNEIGFRSYALNFIAQDRIIFTAGASESARINGAGQLLVGASSGITGDINSVQIISSTSGPLLLRNTNATAGYYWRTGPDNTSAYVIYDETGVGVYLQHGGTAWNPNSSDQRLKNKVSDINNALEAVNKLNPLTFYFKNEPNEGVPRYGYFAQNVGDAIPDAKLVSPKKDEELGEIYTYNKEVIDTYVVAAIKELTQLVSQLKAEIAELKGVK